MIDKLRGIAIFASVVDQGTFRGAARHLGLAPSRISQIVSDLEKELGVTLLYRSSRRLSLTRDGRILHEKARDMLQAAESGLDAISPSSPEPLGELRVTAPAFITQTRLMDRLAAFAKAYPKVELHLNFADQQRGLIENGYDAAIRAGWLEDSEFMNRKIGRLERLLVASPDYFASRPPPSYPKDLEEWDWVRFMMRPKQMELRSADGEIATVTGRSRVSVDNADSLYQLAVRGLGLTVLPEHLAKRGIEHGELVHVLPQWLLQPLGIYVVWPDQSRRENLTAHFVRTLAIE